jgi:tellurite resistance protein TerC
VTAFVATTASQMEVPTWVWYLTVGLMAAALLFDVFIIARRPHVPSTKEVSISLAGYIGAALVFGLGVWWFTHDQAGGKFVTEYYAGWLTEYSLSVDNLFIFLLIMARFGVPEKLQQSALLIGIIIAIILRGIFIAVGAAAINQFSWVFYIFGAFLIYTAVKLGKEGESDDEEYEENRFMKWVERRFPATDKYDGAKLFTHIDGKKLATPMFIVIMALGTTDLLFALTRSRPSTGSPRSPTWSSPRTSSP